MLDNTTDNAMAVRERTEVLSLGVKRSQVQILSPRLPVGSLPENHLGADPAGSLFGTPSAPVPVSAPGPYWAEIPGFPGYEVSKRAEVRESLTGVLMASWRGPKGYRYISLRHESGKRKQVRLSRIVLMAHVGLPFPGAHAAHENGDPSNNRLNNLAWKTPTENEADKVRHGTAPRGERNGLARLTTTKVLFIKKRLTAGDTDMSLALLHGVAENTINDIRRGVTWWHVGNPDGAGRRTKPGRPRGSFKSAAPSTKGGAA